MSADSVSATVKSDRCSVEYLREFWKQVFGNDSQTIIRAVNNAFKSSKTTEDLAESSSDFIVECGSFGCVQLTLTLATSLGDNFMSDGYLATAKLKRDGTELRAFTKVLPHNNMMFLSVQDMKLHKREMIIYEHFHPILNNIGRSIGIQLSVPDAYYWRLDEIGACGTNTTVLAMQDLKQLGFRMVNKRSGCTVEEAKLTLTSLAKYHALSIAFLAPFKDGKIANLPEEIKIITETPSWFHCLFDMMGVQVATFVGLLKKLNQPELALWFEEEYKKNGPKALAVESVTDCGPWVCVVHGDCWNNNMMYRYDDQGKVIEMKMVDWQITRIGHPANDLIYFLFNSTSPETRKEHRGALIDHYYATLSSALIKLGIETISRDQFYEQVRSRVFRGFIFATLILLAISDDKLIAEFEEKDSQMADEDKKTSIDLKELMDEMKDAYKVDEFLKNKFLCERLVAIVQEVKDKQW